MGLSINKEKYQFLKLQSQEEYYQDLLKKLTECDNDLDRLKILTTMMNLVVEEHIIKESFKNE